MLIEANALPLSQTENYLPQTEVYSVFVRSEGNADVGMEHRDNEADIGTTGHTLEHSENIIASVAHSLGRQKT